MKNWGLEPYYDPGRMIHIYEALKGKEWESLLDVACGVGIVTEGLSWMYGDKSFKQFDIEEYPEWKHLKVKPEVRMVEDLLESDEKYDVILFLNSFRNWDKQEQFLEWLKGHCKYFISSGVDGEVIGRDVKGHNLILKTL